MALPCFTSLQELEVASSAQSCRKIGSWGHYPHRGETDFGALISGNKMCQLFELEGLRNIGRGVHSEPAVKKCYKTYISTSTS